MDGRDGLQWLGRNAFELEGLLAMYESYDGREREGREFVRLYSVTDIDTTRADAKTLHCGAAIGMGWVWVLRRHGRG